MPNQIMHPKLSELLPLDQIPNEVEALREALASVFEDIFVKNLIVTQSYDGSSGFYSMTLTTYNSIGIDIPIENDLRLVLNPTQLGATEIPIHFDYSWIILKYIDDFDLSTFDNAIDSILYILFDLAQINEKELFREMILVFYPEAIALEAFVQQFNTQNTQTVTVPSDPDQPFEEKLENIYDEITALDYDLLRVIYQSVIDIDGEGPERLKKLFFRYFTNIEARIKEAITLNFNASIDEISVGLQFPHKWLRPVYTGVEDVTGLQENDVLPDTYFSYLVFDVGSLHYFSKSGFQFRNVSAFNLSRSMIGKTGLIAEFSGLKLDLSKDENIAEADADGRPVGFKGVYAESAMILLPKKWFKKETGQSLAITAKKLLIGTGGISGTIAIQATYATDDDGDATDYFQNYFELDYDNILNPIVVLSNGAEETITSHSDLITHINSLSNPNLLKFKYPFEITVNNTGSTVVFNSEAQYESFLQALDTNGFMWFDLGGSPNKSWKVGFKSFDISFRQGQVVASHLHAQLELKKFKQQGQEEIAAIDLYGEWETEENFKLTASFLPDGLPLNLFDLLTVTLQTAELGKEDGDFFIGADTKISFPEGSFANSLFKGQEIDLPAIRFYFDGRFEIVGGNSFIPVNITLDLGPVEMSVTGIHLGTVQREKGGKMRSYNYIGFDGGLSIDPIGVDIRGNGVKYFYTIDNDDMVELHGGEENDYKDSYFHISTLELDLIIPGTASAATATAIIKGSLTIPEPGVSKEYSGKISLQLPKANIYGEVSMRLNPKYPAYLIEAAVDFPVPIPLGPIGINGFKGLIGQRYVAEKRAIGMSLEDKWYDYYMAPARGINYKKFSGPEMTKDYDTAFSVGVGATFSTMDGGGRTASLRAMMLLSLPSVFAIDAGLTILSERLGLAEVDQTLPPFYAFVMIGDDSIEFGAGANFKVNKSKGWLLTIQGQIEAGFFFKNQAPWYIRFGKPESPIVATLFKDILSINAMSFLMISAQGIETGARVDFSFDFVIAKLHCSLEVGGYISFERPQVGGYVKVDGSLKIDFWIFEITATIGIYMSVELPKPFLIFAEFRFKACARIKLGPIRLTICVPLKFTLKWQKNNTMIYTAIPPLTYEIANDPHYSLDYPKKIQTKNFVKGVNMLTFETFDLVPSVNQEPTVFNIIPLDTYIDIKVEKGLDPSLISTKIGGHTGAASNFIDMIPPKGVLKGGKTVRQVKHRYSISSLEIKAQVGTEWVDYHPFKAIIPDENHPQADLIDNLKIGFWQKNHKQYDTIRLLATNPFSFLDGAEPGWFIPEQYGITASELFCTSSALTGQCADVEEKNVGTAYYPPMNPSDFTYIDGAYFGLKGFFEQAGDIPLGDISAALNSGNAMVVAVVPNPHDVIKSLVFRNANTLVIQLPEDAVQTELKITTHATGATVSYYRRVINEASIFQSYELIESIHKSAGQLLSPVVFGSDTQLDPLRIIAKIEVTPDFPDLDLIQEINIEIEELLINNQESSWGTSAMELTGEDLIRYNELVAKLNYLKDIGCSIENGGECEKDKYLCELYNQLLALYAKCFLPIDIRDITTYCKELECFRDFYNIIREFDSTYPDYELIKDHIQDQYELYAKQLAMLEYWCKSKPGKPEEVVDYYNEFLSNAMSIITIIGDMGNCNCQKEEVLYCTTSFQKVCWTTLADFEINQTIPEQNAVEADTELMIAGMNLTAQPVWRPNTKYYVKFVLKDEVENGQKPPGIFTYYYGFRTVGPLGHFHKYPGAYPIAPTKVVNGVTVPQTIDEFPLTSLSKYLDYERSYPNVDGNLILAKPLFYGHNQCKIDIYFAKPFAYHLLTDWEQYGDLDPIKGGMHLIIKDPISNVIVPYPLPQDWETNESVPESVGNGTDGTSWVDDEDPRIPLNIQLLQNYIASINIAGVMHCTLDLGDSISPAAYAFSVTLTNLKPLKLYTALVYNAFDVNDDGVIADHIDPQTNQILYEENQKIHEYVFQTSRYFSFSAQIESYMLREHDDQGAILNEKQAVYELVFDLTPEQVENAHVLVLGSNNAATLAIETKYFHPFDRVLEGVFGQRPFNPPTTTDFVKIRNEATGVIVALIVRNPEPFNNPKFPLSVVQDTIEVLSGTGINADYNVLFSKDYSQALIMNGEQAINENLRIRFKYKVWNGSQYVIPDDGIIIIENLEIINT